MSDFNRIRQRQRHVWLQTDRQISVKSTNACNSYSGFNEFTQQTYIVHCRRHRHAIVEVQMSTKDKVCVQNDLHSLECKLEDVNAIAWPLHRWNPGGNVPTLRSDATSAGRRHESGTRSCSFPLLDWGPDCWLDREMERWSLVFHQLAAAEMSHAPYVQKRCPATKWLQYK